MSAFNFTFPEMPTYKGNWQSIYFEPIVGSGERITIGVSAISVSGECRVVSAMRPELFECLYGINAPKIISMVDMVLQSIENELHLKKSLFDWIAPINGITLGEVTPACDVDLTGILKQGLRFTASLSSLSINAERDDTDDVQPKRYSSKFSKNIQGQLKLINPAFDSSFNKKLKISTSDTLTTYGFVNDNYASNFGLLLPSRLSSSLNTIKAKIFDIEALKNSDYLLKPKRYEIIIGTPSFEDPTLTDSAILNLKNTLEHVEAIADKDEIRIYRAIDSISAAKHVAKYAA